MVSEAIERITSAEKESEEALRRARGDSKKLVAEAHEQSEHMLDTTRKQARDEERSLVEKSRADAEAEAEGIVGESRTGVEQVRASAGGKVAAGVAKVLESITAAA